MPRRAVELSALEVPSQSSYRDGHPDDVKDRQDSSKGRQNSGKAPKSSNGRGNRRFSPWKKQAVPPGPATQLINDIEHLGIEGPISSRTRNRKKPADFSVPLPDSSSSTLNASSSTEPTMIGMGGPIERQNAREERFHARLEKQQTSWWDSAALAVAEKAQRTDMALVAATAAAQQTQGTLHASRPFANDRALLARGRNHARAEIARVDKWRDDAFATFLDERRAATPMPVVPEQLPSEPKSFSPGHFDRLYGKKPLVGKKILPPVRARGQVSKSADAAALGGKAPLGLMREAATRAARANAFAGAAEITQHFH